MPRASAFLPSEKTVSVLGTWSSKKPVEQDPETLIKLLRVWGRVGFFFFVAVGIIVGAVVVVGGNLSLRSAVVVCSIFALGVLALALARLYEGLAGRFFLGRRSEHEP